jgi:hypothetical protein
MSNFAAEESECRLHRSFQNYCADCMAQSAYEEWYEESGQAARAKGNQVQPSKLAPMTPLAAEDRTMRQDNGLDLRKIHPSLPADLLRRSRAAAALEEQSLAVFIAESLVERLKRYGF